MVGRRHVAGLMLFACMNILVLIIPRQDNNPFISSYKRSWREQYDAVVSVSCQILSVGMSATAVIPFYQALKGDRDCRDLGVCFTALQFISAMMGLKCGLAGFGGSVIVLTSLFGSLTLGASLMIREFLLRSRFHIAIRCLSAAGLLVVGYHLLDFLQLEVQVGIWSAIQLLPSIGMYTDCGNALLEDNPQALSLPVLVVSVFNNALWTLFAVNENSIMLGIGPLFGLMISCLSIVCLYNLRNKDWYNMRFACRDIGVIVRNNPVLKLPTPRQLSVVLYYCSRDLSAFNLSFINMLKPTADEQPIVKSSDMAEFMVMDAFEFAKTACKKFSVEKDVASYIKKEFDRKHNPTWHCIVGRNFGSYVTHETGCFIYFYVGQLAILLFKSG